jgi:hypothetical protein
MPLPGESSVGELARSALRHDDRPCPQGLALFDSSMSYISCIFPHLICAFWNFSSVLFRSPCFFSRYFVCLSFFSSMSSLRCIVYILQEYRSLFVFPMSAMFLIPCISPPCYICCQSWSRLCLIVLFFFFFRHFTFRILFLSLFLSLLLSVMSRLLLYGGWVYTIHIQNRP